MPIARKTSPQREEAQGQTKANSKSKNKELGLVSNKNAPKQASKGKAPTKPAAKNKGQVLDSSNKPSKGQGKALSQSKGLPTNIDQPQRQLIANKSLEALSSRYPSPQSLLEYHNPWELLVATILAAQCTDERVNKITPALFERWPGPAQMALSNAEELEPYIRSAGFFRNKAKSILGSARKIMQDYQGEVPANLADLLSLPGVARKTANVVLFGAFDLSFGLAVDTHVGRISYRLGLTSSKDPVKIEQDLMSLFPQDQWGDLNHRMVWFGRHVCQARKPNCQECELSSFCPKLGLAD